MRTTLTAITWTTGLSIAPARFRTSTGLPLRSCTWSSRTTLTWVSPARSLMWSIHISKTLSRPPSPRARRSELLVGCRRPVVTPHLRLVFVGTATTHAKRSRARLRGRNVLGLSTVATRHSQPVRLCVKPIRVRASSGLTRLAPPPSKVSSHSPTHHLHTHTHPHTTLALIHPSKVCLGA